MFIAAVKRFFGILFIIIGALTNRCFAQVDALTRSFLESQVKDTSFIYRDRIDDYDVTSLKETLNKFPDIKPYRYGNSIEFSKKEIAEIEKRAQSVIAFKWTEKTFEKATLITKDTTDHIFNDRSLGWDYFYKHYGRSFATLSKPIFIRNNTICIFYKSYNCGWLCGYGGWAIYRKENGKWIFKDSLTYWIS